MSNTKIKKSSLFLLPILIAILFTGCFSSKNHMPKEDFAMPQWYLNAPQNNSVFIYGTGSGDEIEEAKSNALSNMASSLLVNVQSTLNVKKTASDDGLYSKDITKNIKLEVEKIRFTNVKIEKSKQSGFSVYVLTKVDRNKLFNENKKEFEIQDKRLNKIFSSLNRLSKFEQITKLQNEYKNIISNKKKAYVLYAIDNNFDYGQYFSKYDKYIDRITQIKSSLRIKVSSNEKGSFFRNEFINILNENNFNVSRNGNSDIRIAVVNKSRFSKARRWHIVKTTSTIKVLVNGKIMSNKIINTIGRSTSSKTNALQSAAEDFADQIKEEGLDKIVFKK